MARLARPLDSLKPRYDAIVIGSGYGGSVAAARLARGGKRVAVLERGREFATGEFPSRFPDLRKEMRVTGRSFSSGSDTALYDVRLGDDMHVLVGCGLGGGSLVNAGVALRPDARVFADEVWPGQIVAGRAARSGFCGGAALVAPGTIGTCAGAREISGAEIEQCGARRSADRARGGHQLRRYRQSCGHRAASLHVVRRLLRGMQRRRQEHDGLDLSAVRSKPWRGDFHAP